MSICKIIQFTLIMLFFLLNRNKDRLLVKKMCMIAICLFQFLMPMEDIFAKYLKKIIRIDNIILRLSLKFLIYLKLELFFLGLQVFSSTDVFFENHLFMYFPHPSTEFC